MPPTSDPPAPAAPAPSQLDPNQVDLGQVAPALAAYVARIGQQLRSRAGLGLRDQSLVRLSTLMATGQTSDLAAHLGQALDDGVTASEISETLTHLAFYVGWPRAMAAVPSIAAVFSERGVDPDTLPPVDPTLLPLDEETEAARDRQVRSDFGTAAPGVVDATRDVLFRDLWLRPALAPRDRSLVTVVALVANGHTAQTRFHLGKALDRGLTASEVGEILHQLAYDVGWPPVFTALPVVRDVLDSRA